MGALLALYERDAAIGGQRAASGTGQVVDVALTESVLAVLESMIPEADRGVVRERAGTTITGIVPSNTYPCRDGRHVVIGANNASNFARLMEAVGRADLAADPSLRTNPARVARQAELDLAIERWTRERDADEVVATLEASSVPAGVIQHAGDLLRDPQLVARGMIETVETPSGALAVPAIPPVLSRTPARTAWAGPELGAHTREVLAALGVSDRELEALSAEGVIALR
jgi:crotonobetainyl-CoA:carnitine CoA-transferase CaiB-like acyl-CoA transferase